MIPGVVIIGDACQEPLRHTGQTKKSDLVVTELRDARDAASQLVGMLEQQEATLSRILVERNATAWGNFSKLATKQ